MRRTLLTTALAACIVTVATVPSGVPAAATDDRVSSMSAHDFGFTSIDGAPMPMTTFAGKTVLLVNTASECGFTPQYRALQEVWQQYRDRGLVVLGVPSNDFGGQEPGTEAEIKRFCEVTYGIDFPMTEKQAVIGPDAHPLYRWIANNLGEDHAPRWNFHKYLIDGEGSLVGAWPSRVEPKSDEVRAAIEEHLPN